MTDKPKEETPKKEVKVEVKEEVEKPKDTITIPKDTFDRMVKDIDMLKSTADSKRMAVYQTRHKGEQVPVVNLREMNGKVIMGWRTVKNDVHFNTAKRVWVEDQTIELLFEDGSSDTVSYKDFVNNYQSVSCEQIGSSEEGGDVALKLRRKDNGKEYLVGVKYVN